MSDEGWIAGLIPLVIAWGIMVVIWVIYFVRFTYDRWWKTCKSR